MKIKTKKKKRDNSYTADITALPKCKNEYVIE